MSWSREFPTVLLRRPPAGIRRGGPACATGTTHEHNQQYFSGGEPARLRAAWLGEILASDAVGVVRRDRHARNQVAETVHEMESAGDRELAVAIEHSPDQVGVLGLQIGEFVAEGFEQAAVETTVRIEVIGHRLEAGEEVVFGQVAVDVIAADANRNDGA